MRPRPVSSDGLALVNAPSKFWTGTGAELAELWQHRELLRTFAARELRARYKGSRLGWAWALVRPLVMLLIYGLAVGVFLGAGRAIPEFMIFIYAGLLAWGLFSAIVTGCINSVIGNGALVSRARFPRLLLPLSALLAACVDFVLQASVLIVGYLVFQDAPMLEDFLIWFPRSLLVIIFLAFGIGLVLAALNVYLRDVQFLTDVALQVGFWLVPILYSYGQIVRGAQAFGMSAEWVTRIYMVNPMANAVLGFQRALWPPAGRSVADAFAFPGRLDLRLWVFLGLSLLVAWLGMRIYSRLATDFGQEL